MLAPPFNRFHYILASQSPRRQHLLKGMGFDFDIIVREIDEGVPEHLNGKEIAMFLSEAKSHAFNNQDIKPGTIVITADTIVWHQGSMLGKPVSRDEAIKMIKRLSGSRHEVFTGVTLKSHQQVYTFCDTTEVDFRKLTPDQIEYYINEYQPFDKAGAYGVQEWIGYIGVESITGSFYNVMGLPTQLLYPELEKFLLKEEEINSNKC